MCGACPDTQVASLAQILNTCKHYEFKVAHRYDTKSMAARLLFDLSSEVQTLALALLNAGFGKSPHSTSPIFTFTSVACSFSRITG